MSRLHSMTSPLWILSLIVAFIPLALPACSVPVFRYALEHWPADPYQAIVFHRGPLTDAQQTLARKLGADGSAGRLHANVSLRTVDLDRNPQPDDLQFWQQLGVDSLPWLVVRYPIADRLPGNVLSATPTATAIQQLLDSPARREIGRRLADGQSAVWVLLEIGDREKDAAAAQLIESRLAYLRTVLKLPTLDEQDIVNGLVSVGAGELRLEFSTLQLSRKDPAENAFVQMLLGTESDLRELNEPMVFPIFGRGRALYALIGKGINHETIDEAASFLIGQCSCEVKELNPGVDLLMAADWDAAVKPSPKPAAALSTKSNASESAPFTVSISGNDAPNPVSTAAAPDGQRSISKTRIVTGIVVALLIAAALLIKRK